MALNKILSPARFSEHHRRRSQKNIKSQRIEIYAIKRPDGHGMHTTLTNSLQIWLSAQDLYMIVPVNIS